MNMKRAPDEIDDLVALLDPRTHRLERIDQFIHNLFLVQHLAGENAILTTEYNQQPRSGGIRGAGLKSETEEPVTRADVLLR
jgi:hypothetical protein